MVDLLRRDVAPVPDEAWKQIDETALRVLKAELAGRSVVDFVGPHGWEFAAVNLGRLEVRSKPDDQVPWGLRQVQPLVEVRIGFRVPQMEIDNAARGAKDIKLD